MAHYISRILDARLAWLVENTPAVVVDGAKAVGKTSSARRLASTVFEMDRKEARELLSSSPRILLQSDSPALLDEWQRTPELWDQVRRAVDDDGQAGRFILTGSAYPLDAKIHSGAGRIVHLRLRPLSLAERSIAEQTVSLESLLNDPELIVEGATELESVDYLTEILSSGFPGIRDCPLPVARVRLDGYIEDIIERRLPNQGIEIRKPQSLIHWLRAFAAASASTASYEAILNGATPGEIDKPSKSTTLLYREALASLWLLDQIDPWLPLNTTFTYLGKTSKHHLVDPALAARLLNLTEHNLTRGVAGVTLGPQKKTLAGRLFESLVALSLQTYCQAIDARLYHLRTPNGNREIDFIVERGNDVVAIEAKFAPLPESKDLRHLSWLPTEFPDYRIARVVLTTGTRAYTRNDGIHVVPAALLGV